MLQPLILKVDKFTFSAPVDRYYSRQGLWLQEESVDTPGGEGVIHVKIGLSDFLQQRSGDVAFVELKPQGTHTQTGDELAVIETIKVNLSLDAPLPGTIAAVNLELDSKPELVNLDPYGAGWLVILEATDWDVEKALLLDAEAYLEIMRLEANQAGH